MKSGLFIWFIDSQLYINFTFAAESNGSLRDLQWRWHGHRPDSPRTTSWKCQHFQLSHNAQNQKLAYENKWFSTNTCAGAQTQAERSPALMTTAAMLTGLRAPAAGKLTIISTNVPGSSWAEVDLGRFGPREPQSKYCPGRQLPPAQQQAAELMDGSAPRNVCQTRRGSRPSHASFERQQGKRQI